MKFKTLLFIILAFSLTACGEKKSTASVKLKIFQSNILSAGSANLNGGVLVMGKSEDGKHSFKLGVADAQSDLSLNLPKGRWEFAALSWDGEAVGAIMTGDNRCAYTGFVDLKDAEASVTFNLTATRCMSDFNGRQFSDPAFIDSGTKRFLPLIPISCFQTTEANMDTTNCPVNTNNSNFSSFKIVFPGDIKGGVSGAATSLVSGCFPLSGASSHPRVPMTSALSDSPLGFRIEFYTGANCSEELVPYNFRDGALNNMNAGALHKFQNDGVNYNYFFINPGVAHDARTPSITGMNLLLPTAIYASGTYYINNSSAVPYVISGGIPQSAVQMCVTENTTCSAGEWRNISSADSISISPTDGVHTLKLFYRNAFGSESSYVMNYFTLVTIPPTFTPGTTTVGTTYITFNWTASGFVVPLIGATQLQVCDSPSCTGTIYATVNAVDPTTGTYTLLNSSLSVAIPSMGTVYTKLTVTDLFAVQEAFTLTSVTVIPGMGIP